MTLTFDPPLGPAPQVTRVTNGSRQLRATVVDVDGREITIAPGEAVEARLVLGAIAMGPRR